MEKTKYSIKNHSKYLLIKFWLISTFIITVLIAQDKVLYLVNEEPTKMKRSDSEWKRILSAAEYHILREKGTERAFTGEYDGHFEEGTYVCAGCGNKIFESETKYRSGCGWPAFHTEHEDAGIIRIVDLSHGMSRIEVRCGSCEAHLGHVFEDGPREHGGERYCINSVCLDFIMEGEDG